MRRRWVCTEGNIWSTCLSASLTRNALFSFRPISIVWEALRQPNSVLGTLTNLAGAPPDLCLFSAAAIAFLRIPFVGTFQASGLRSMCLRHGYIIRLNIVKKETVSSARTSGSTPGEYICSYIFLVRQGSASLPSMPRTYYAT